MLPPKNHFGAFHSPNPLRITSAGKLGTKTAVAISESSRINSVELHPQGETSRIWGKATDLSLGGCFVEMPIPLKQGTTIKMALRVVPLAAPDRDHPHPIT